MTSTTIPASVEAIYDHFTTTWASATEIGFDNENFRPSAQNVSWARVSVRHRTSRQDSLGAPGGRKFMRFGAVMVQLFVPVDAGSAPLATLMQTAVSALEGVVLSGVGYRVWLAAALARELGQDGIWNAALVEVPFSYEEVK